MCGNTQRLGNTLTVAFYLLLGLTFSSTIFFLLLGGIVVAEEPHNDIDTDNSDASTQSSRSSNEAAEHSNTDEGLIREIDTREATEEILPRICGDNSERIYRGTCSGCPNEDGEDEWKLRFVSGYVGDFSGDGNEYAIIQTTGCGGTRYVLLRADDDGENWSMLHYPTEPSMPGTCQPVSGSQHGYILCWQGAGQGLPREVRVRVLQVLFVSGERLQSEILDGKYYSHAWFCPCGGRVQHSPGEILIDDLTGDGNDEVAIFSNLRFQEHRAEIELMGERCDSGEYDYSETTAATIWSIYDTEVEIREDIACELDHSKFENLDDCL